MSSRGSVQPVRVPKLAVRNRQPETARETNKQDGTIIPAAPSSDLSNRSDLLRQMSSAPVEPSKKKKSGFFSFLTLKEPSALALEQYAEKQRIHSASKVSRANCPAKKADLSKRKLPETVPKVNSKWDGMPESAKLSKNGLNNSPWTGNSTSSKSMASSSSSRGAGSISSFHSVTSTGNNLSTTFVLSPPHESSNPGITTNYPGRSSLSVRPLVTGFARTSISLASSSASATDSGVSMPHPYLVHDTGRSINSREGATESLLSSPRELWPPSPRTPMTPMDGYPLPTMTDAKYSQSKPVAVEHPLPRDFGQFISPAYTKDDSSFRSSDRHQPLPAPLSLRRPKSFMHLPTSPMSAKGQDFAVRPPLPTTGMSAIMAQHKIPPAPISLPASPAGGGPSKFESRPKTSISANVMVASPFTQESQHSPLLSPAFSVRSRNLGSRKAEVVPWETQTPPTQPTEARPVFQLQPVPTPQSRSKRNSRLLPFKK